MRATLVIAALTTLMGCSEPSESTMEISENRAIEELQTKYPRIPAGDIRVPPESDLRNPNFDVGGHCLEEERMGNGSFEECLEVVGRELVAMGGPDRR